jgi:hypothetical protein
LRLRRVPVIRSRAFDKSPNPHWRRAGKQDSWRMTS